MNFKDFIRVSCALGALSAVTPALAQEASTGIGDVVVTASKRATNVQDTPIAITAVTQDTITRQGVYQIQDLTRVAPEVRVQAGQFNVVQIRGLRTGQYGPTIDTPNAVHLDGNYLARFTGLNGFFYDLERVEVLAGPQGTLYGRNSVGGAINFITHKPDLGKFGGTVGVDIGNYNQMILNGAINLPIGDNLAIRVAGMRNTRDGFYTDTNGGAVDLQGYRVSAKWTPSERDTLTVTADSQKERVPQGTNATITRVLRNPTIFTVTTVGTAPGPAATVGVGSVALSCPNVALQGGNPGTVCSSSVVPIIASDDIWHNRVVTSNDYASAPVETDGIAAQWDHDFGFATLTAQTSLRSLDLVGKAGQIAGGTQDPRLRAAAVAGLTPGQGGATGLGFNANDSNWNSQEIRLVSNDSDQTTFKYTAGVSHFHEQAFGDGPTETFASWYSNNSVARPGTVIGSLNLPQGADGLPIVTGVGAAAGEVTTDAYAVFGEVTYTPAAWQALHLTLGGRYNWEEKHGISESYTQSQAGRSYTYAPYPASGQVICPAGTAAVLCPRVAVQYTSFDETKDYERATYKGNIQYDLTDSNMVYATYSTGYVSGGFAFGVPQTGNISDPDHSYRPMTIESFEIGSKNRFFDNRVQLNLSAYKYEFANYLTNQTFQVPDPNAGPPFNRSGVITAANAADTEYKGATFDFTAQITENDTFRLNGQYTEAEVKFDLAQLYFNTTQAYLQSQGYDSSRACTLAVMTGSPTGARTTAATASIGPNCSAPGTTPLTFLGTNAVYGGSAFPGDFAPEGSFERPKWELNADYTHTFQLPSATLDAQVSWHYTSRGVAGNGLVSVPLALERVIPAGFTNAFDVGSTGGQAFRVPEKDTWDLSLRYQRDDANWSITAYARNVLDSENLLSRNINSNLQGVGSWNLDTLQAADVAGNILAAPQYLYVTEAYEAPRTFGVQFQASF